MRIPSIRLPRHRVGSPAVRKTGRYKWIFCIAIIPLYILGLGLMIHFRQPNVHIGYIIMCEIFSMSGSVFILLLQIAIFMAVDHQHVAAALALLQVAGSIGGAIGNTISGTIWTNTFFSALERKLPESALPNIATIYSSLPAQLDYPVGTPERLGIQEAYGYAQARMLAVGVAVSGLSFVWKLMFRNYDLKNMAKQTRGTVF